MDNGAETLSHAFTEWAAPKGIAVRYIQPGKQNQTEVLNPLLFSNLQQVQSITDSWLIDYNEYSPHDSLGGMPAMQFMPRITIAPTVYRSLCLLDGEAYGMKT